jgi:hypothetical protein
VRLAAYSVHRSNAARLAGLSGPLRSALVSTDVFAERCSFGICRHDARDLAYTEFPPLSGAA